MEADSVSRRGAEFCSSTSAHGFSHIVSSKHLRHKVLWSSILLGVFGCTCYHLYSIVSAYLDYTYYTSISNADNTEEPLKVKF